MSHPATFNEHNLVPLTRDKLLVVLYDLSARLHQLFNNPVRLVVHGGAVMVLHPYLTTRESTRDVDYCHRSFVAEWKKLGVHDAESRLLSCIAAVAKKYNLGLDWMNSHADVALPLSRDVYGKIHDPIYHDATTPANMTLNTIFTSPGLVLIGVSWSWAVALKLVRYQKHDPYDIACVLALGRKMKGLKWSLAMLEWWLTTLCSAMGYSAYPPQRMEEARQRMRHAISLEASLAQHPPRTHLPSTNAVSAAFPSGSHQAPVFVR